MKKQSIWIFGSICTVMLVAFNNCSGGFQAADVALDLEETLDSASLGTRRSLEASSSSSSSAGQSGAQSGNSAAAVYPYKIYIGKSIAGPWVESGDVCRGETTYFRAVGFSMDKKIKGCMNLNGKPECLDLSKHREFTSSERINGDIVTVASATETASWPLDKFTMFVSELVDDRTVILRTVGTVEAKNCAGSGSSGGSTGSAPAGLKWTWVQRTACIGPTPAPAVENQTCSPAGLSASNGCGVMVCK